ncbi:hypothetical protein KFE25_007796 [Diacronema lutheri]|uniref:EF-hand domain-containing protein n=1 Tax=Diacronema lutheri TaxID=2081491 RepID=A0A8J5XJZ6_DIALT|nr:hypothetical protein KFE25_007796 [Diacronema lutheri]
MGRTPEKPAKLAPLPFAKPKPATPATSAASSKRETLLRPATPAGTASDVLSPADKAKARSVFEAADLDGSGMLEAEELCAVLKSLGHEVSTTRMREMLAPFDLRSRGALDLDSFERMIAAHGGTYVARSRVELDAEALMDCICASENDPIKPPPADVPPRAPSGTLGYDGLLPSTRIAPESLRNLEQSLVHDFGLSVRITDLIDPPITEEKIRSFLVEAS